MNPSATSRSPILNPSQILEITTSVQSDKRIITQAKIKVDASQTHTTKITENHAIDAIRSLLPRVPINIETLSDQSQLFSATLISRFDPTSKSNNPYDSANLPPGNATENSQEIANIWRTINIVDRSVISNKTTIMLKEITLAKEKGSDISLKGLLTQMRQWCPEMKSQLNYKAIKTELTRGRTELPLNRGCADQFIPMIAERIREAESNSNNHPAASRPITPPAYFSTDQSPYYNNMHNSTPDSPQQTLFNKLDRLTDALGYNLATGNARALEKAINKIESLLNELHQLNSGVHFNSHPFELEKYDNFLSKAYVTLDLIQEYDSINNTLNSYSNAGEISQESKREITDRLHNLINNAIQMNISHESFTQENIDIMLNQLALIPESFSVGMATQLIDDFFNCAPGHRAEFIRSNHENFESINDKAPSLSYDNQELILRKMLGGRDLTSRNYRQVGYRTFYPDRIVGNSNSTSNEGVAFRLLENLVESIDRVRAERGLELIKGS